MRVIEPMKAPTKSVPAEEVRFPVLVSMKLDGLRGLHVGGHIVSKTLNRFRNDFTHQLFTNPALANMDGELVVGVPYGGDVIRRSYSGVMSKEGEPDVRLYVFDDFTMPTATYRVRHQMLRKRLHNLPAHLRKRVVLLEHTEVTSLTELMSIEADALRIGYEGLMLRDPLGPYKFGRATMREGWLLKFKRFIDDEAVCTGVEEGAVNENERKADGKRRTLRAGMRPNGMVGTVLGKDLKTGEPIRVAAGRLSHDERLHYMRHPEQIVDRVFTYRRFPTGTYAAPRFPTFQTFRDASDL